MESFGEHQEQPKRALLPGNLGGLDPKMSSSSTATADGEENGEEGLKLFPHAFYISFLCKYISGWWFGTCFSIQLGTIIPFD